MRPVCAVALAMLRGWRHEVIRSLGEQKWAYRAVVALVGLAAIGWAALALTARNMLGIADVSGKGLQLMLLATTLNLAFALAAVMAVGLAVLVPEESAFATLLATMPMGAAQRRVALDVPVVSCALATAVLVSGPFVWLSISLAGGWDSGLAIVVAWLAVSVTGVLLGAALHRGGAVFLGLLLRLSQDVARPVAAIAVYVVLAQQCLVSDVGRATPGAPTRRGLRLLADACFSRPVEAIAGCAALPLFAAAMWWLATSASARWAPRQRSHLVGALAGRTRARARPLVVLELLQLVRHPVNQSTVLLLGVIAVATPLVSQVRDVLLWPVGGVLFLSVTSLLVVGCYGATWAHHWLFRSASSNPVGWVRSKWAAAITFWLGLVAVLLGVFAVTPLWNMRIAAAAAPQLTLAFVMSMVVGLAVPASAEQPLSSVIGIVIAAVGGIGLYLATDRVSGGSTPLLLVLVGFLTVAGVVGYVRLARWRERDLLF